MKAAGKKLKAKVKLNKSALATQLAENFNYICNCNAINFQHTHTHTHTDTHTHTRKFAQKYATNMEGRARGGGGVARDTFADTYAEGNDNRNMWQDILI